MIDLMKPRWKCIASMPFKPYADMYNIDDILTDPGGGECIRDQNDRPVFAIPFDNYPHLFRPLQWWEEREEGEMPEYVKWSSTVYRMSDIDFDALLHPDVFLPATLAEYQEYQSRLSPEA